MRRHTTVKMLLALFGIAIAVGRLTSLEGSAQGDLQGKTVVSLSAYPKQLAPEEAARVSNAAIVGTVVHLDTPRWSTPDGLAPSAEMRGKVPYVIFRTATVRVEETLFGETSSLVQIPLLGGQVGESIMAVDGVDFPFIAVGDRLAVFLADPPAGWQLERTVNPTVQLYMVKDDTAWSGDSPALSISELRERAQSASDDEKSLPAAP